MATIAVLGSIWNSEDMLPEDQYEREERRQLPFM